MTLDTGSTVHWNIRRWNSLFCLSILLAVCIAFAADGMAQAIDGNVVGSVVDPSAAAIPNAGLELENTATGVKYAAKSGADGLYRFNNVPVGTYNLTIRTPGFANTEVKNVTVELNRTTTANVKLQVQTAAETISVEATVLQVDISTSQLQSTFEAEQVGNMPIIESAGNFFGALNMSLLSAGVTSSGGVGQGTGPSVGGQRPMNNNFMIEGVDNNNKAITGPLAYVPTDATQEFSLLQNNYSSEFGHSTGGQFNTIIKRGTNAIHGSFYEYFQNRKLNALDQQFARQGLSKERYDQNRFGGSVGGPIVRNKWFYFGSLEYAPLGQAYTLSPPVSTPTAAGYALLNAMPGISSTNLSVLKQYAPASPLANDSTTVNGVSIPIGIMPISGAYYTNQYAGVASSDYKLSDRDELRGRFVFNKLDQLDNLANLPTFWTTLPQRFYVVTIADYHIFSANLTNEGRLGFNRFTQYYVDPGLKFPGLDRFPNITFDNDLGLQLGPDPNAPQYVVQNTYQLVDNLSWIAGAHSFKFGFDGRRIISPQHFIQRERGDYGYPDLNAYLNDAIPENLAERNLGDTTYYGNEWATYLYAQDDWHVRRNLTLNLGIRWERTSVPKTQSLQSLNSISDIPGVISFRAPKASNKNFAPRIGLAYTPGTDGKTSIRAGFGMAYDVIFDNVGSTAYPPQLTATVDAGDHPTLYTAPFLAKGGIQPGSIATGGNLTVDQARAATSSYIPDQVLPYSIQWTLGVQHELTRNNTIEVRYVGTRGVHLLVQNRMFRTAPVTATQNLPTYLQAPSQAALDALPNTLAGLQSLSNNPILGPLGFLSAITWWPPIGNSSYNGLATQYTRRMSRGLQFIGAYTWSHNIDDSTATHFSTYLTPRRQQDFMDLKADKASSALDRRHRLTLNWTLEPSWGKQNTNALVRNLVSNWRWVGTYTYESPEFVTVQSGTDSNLNGDTAGDRTIINPNGDPLTGSGSTALKNSSGDIVAYLADDPTARYIKAGLGAYANGGRNTLATNPIDNFDMSFARKFPVKEGHAIEVRADFSNVFNHPQFVPGYVNSVRLNQNYITSRDFLIPGNTRFAKWDQVFPSNSRSAQLVLKYMF